MITLEIGRYNLHAKYNTVSGEFTLTEIFNTLGTIEATKDTGQIFISGTGLFKQNKTITSVDYITQIQNDPTYKVEQTENQITITFQNSLINNSEFQIQIEVINGPQQ